MSSETAQTKRKRQPDGEKGPSKKRARNGAEPAAAAVAADEPSRTVKVTHAAKGKTWAPVIVSAPGLSIPPGTSFEAFQQLRTNELLLHSSDHPKLDYTAREYQEGGVEGHLKHYIAIYDPRKRRAQILEAKSLSVRSTLRNEEQQVRREEREQNDAAPALSERQHLGLEFGTKKAKKAIGSVSQNLIRTVDDAGALAASPEAMKKAIKSNPAAAALLESMAEDAANAPSKDELEAVVNEAKPRPKHNPDATQPSDLYPVGELIGDETMKTIKVKPWFDAIEDGQAVVTPSRFVANRLTAIVEKGEDDSVQKVRLLKWILVLLKFHMACKKIKGGGLRLPKREDLSQKMGEDASLIDIVRDKFTPGASEMTKWHVDNLVTHMATCSLIVDDFESDMHNLREDLGLGPRVMNQYFREIGCRIVRMTETQRARAQLTQAEALDHKLARLTVPPEFPKQNSVPLTRPRGRPPAR